MKFIYCIIVLCINLFVLIVSFAQDIDSVETVSLLAFGDVNLGRAVGQKILKGQIDYPFENCKELFAKADIIFANLESAITEQNGETQSPKSNLIFCAPPEASNTLRRAGISIVSTANNHACDYGLKGIIETIEFLNKSGVKYVGTRNDTNVAFTPVIIEKNIIKIGFVAYTKIFNNNSYWNILVSNFDTTRAKEEIRFLKSQVDFIVASYHGGDEYKDEPSKDVKLDMRLLANYGADIILGHHPHVPNGIEIYNNSLIFYSLGNAVFNQPHRYWTQRSYACLFEFEKKGERKNIRTVEIIPFRTGFQIKMDLGKNEIDELIERIRNLSNVKIIQKGRSYFVDLYN